MELTPAVPGHPKKSPVILYCKGRKEVIPVDSIQILPLGDQAALVYLRQERDALAFAGAIRRTNFSWLIDVVPAYSSVAIYFAADQIDFPGAQAELAQILQETCAENAPEGRTHHIPCCYELGLDLERIAGHTGLDAEGVIRLHTSTAYTVYAIGFCPGFPYLGYLPPQLSGVPRLPSPRLRVEGGSVGLTGRQTGIYPEARPGGWNILGRTPLELVNLKDNYFPLGAGDRVQFERIDETEFRRLQGQRL
jgi:inhibitor of KinA